MNPLMDADHSVDPRFGDLTTRTVDERIADEFVVTRAIVVGGTIIMTNLALVTIHEPIQTHASRIIQSHALITLLSLTKV